MDHELTLEGAKIRKSGRLLLVCFHQTKLNVVEHEITWTKSIELAFIGVIGYKWCEFSWAFQRWYGPEIRTKQTNERTNKHRIKGECVWSADVIKGECWWKGNNKYFTLTVSPQVTHSCLVFFPNVFWPFNASDQVPMYTQQKRSWTLVKDQFSQKCLNVTQIKSISCEAGGCLLYFDIKRVDNNYDISPKECRGIYTCRRSAISATNRR